MFFSYRSCTVPVTFILRYFIFLLLMGSFLPVYYLSGCGLDKKISPNSILDLLLKLFS